MGKQKDVDEKNPVLAREDIGRRSFFRRAGLITGTAVVAPLLAGCTDLVDNGDPPSADADVTRADYDPSDPVRYADASRSDSDVGD